MKNLPVILIFIAILFLGAFIGTLDLKNKSSVESYYEKQFNSLLKLNNEYKKTILNYEKQIAVQDRKSVV